MARLQTELQKNPAAHLVGSFDPSRSCSRCRELLGSTESEGHKFHLHAPLPPPVLIEKTEHWSSYGSELPDSLCGKFTNITLRNFRRVLILKWSEAQIFASLG